MTRSKNKIELQVGDKFKDGYTRNVDNLYKDGMKVDLNHELERILMGSDIREGDHVTLNVKINKNGESPDN